MVAACAELPPPSHPHPHARTPPPLPQIHRGKGDILEYSSLFHKVRGIIGDMVTKASVHRMK